MGPTRNSMRTAAAMVAAASATSAAQQAAYAQAKDRAVAAAQQAQLAAAKQAQSDGIHHLNRARLGSTTDASAVARQRQQGSAKTPSKVSSSDGVHIHIHQDGVPTLNPEGKSGPQKTTGSVGKVRQLTFEERAAALGSGVDAHERLNRARQRVGHKFNVEIRPDGTIVHKYGNDVPADMRNIVVKSARRHGGR